MAQKQKRLLIAVVIVAGGLTLTLTVLAQCAPDPGGLPSPMPSVLLPTPDRECQQKGAQLLAQAGLAGTVTLASDGVLHLEIPYTLASSQTVEDAAQSVWVAFDVALALQNQDECVSLTHVAVVILLQGGQTDARIDANVSAADLVAFGAGDLSEEAFIDRVTYAIETKD
jgi:hypothetical protein